MVEAGKRKTVFLLHKGGMTQREIARRFSIARQTVRTIIKQEGAMPRIERSHKQRIDPELLQRLYTECMGSIKRMHEALAKHYRIFVKYSTLTHILRALGITKSHKARCKYSSARQSSGSQSSSKVAARTSVSWPSSPE